MWGGTRMIYLGTVRLKLYQFATTREMENRYQGEETKQKVDQILIG
jgi:hypothetical protein